MQSAKEKISNMASAAKEHITICRAKVQEKAEKAAARTHEEKQIAKERRKAIEAQAKMELHQAKATHAARKLSAKRATHHHHHHHHPLTGQNYLATVDATAYGGNEPVVGTYPASRPVGTPATMAGTTAPAYPLGGHSPHKYV